jgi:hypothetical protein
MNSPVHNHWWHNLAIPLAHCTTGNTEGVALVHMPPFGASVPGGHQTNGAPDPPWLSGKMNPLATWSDRQGGRWNFPVADTVQENQKVQEDQKLHSAPQSPTGYPANSSQLHQPRYQVPIESFLGLKTLGLRYRRAVGKVTQCLRG